ncbi:MAG: zinc ribbon domain-containing protein [Candidatus Heimdallarchaeota archaeon]
MSRKGPTWFGIILSKKQATQVFILSFAGIFILSMITLPMITSFIMSLRSAITYDEFEWWIQSLPFNLPYFGILIAFLVISIYSLIKSRKVAKSYSEVIEAQHTESKPLLFCPNCGNKRTALENFCRVCGEQFK